MHLLAKIQSGCLYKGTNQTSALLVFSLSLAKIILKKYAEQNDYFSNYYLFLHTPDFPTDCTKFLL